MGAWLVVIGMLAALLSGVDALAASGARASARVEGAAVEPGNGVMTAAAKPVREVVACLWIVLGFGGVLLAFATGTFAPVVAVLIAGVALEVCT